MIYLQLQNLGDDNKLIILIHNTNLATLQLTVKLPYSYLQTLQPIKEAKTIKHKQNKF